MGVSTRHTRRILAAYREKGAAAIAHGNRGRRPANATPSTLSIEAVRPPVRPLRDEDTQQLNSLTTRRSQLMTMLVAEKNRLRRASHSVHPSIWSHISWLE